MNGKIINLIVDKTYPVFKVNCLLTGSHHEMAMYRICCKSSVNYKICLKLYKHEYGFFDYSKRVKI